MEYTCTRCNQPQSDNLCGTADEPYCPQCWLIHYFGIPQSVVDEIDAEIAGYRQMGVVDDTLETLRYSALNKHAEKKRREILLRERGFPRT